MSTTADPLNIRALSMYSGGLCSWAATKRYAEANGTSGLYLLFADTLIEDEDLYRFLIEGAANVLGVDRGEAASLAATALDIPPVEADRWEDRVEALGALRRAAASLIPQLVWIADGRNPWQVFVGERFIGNSKVDPCSKILKRKLMDRWRYDHCVNWKTTLIFGLDWSERGRIYGDRGSKPGHKKLTEDKGWRPIYPMDERPYLTHADRMDWAKSEGLKTSRMYDMGLQHDNCGGLCVKAGFAQMKHLLSVMPERYRWHEGQELLAQAAIGTDSTVMTYKPSRKRSKAKNITLRQLRELIEQQGTLFDDHGWGCGGGCALDNGEEEEQEK